MLLYCVLSDALRGMRRFARSMNEENNPAVVFCECGRRTSVAISYEETDPAMETYGK